MSQNHFFGGNEKKTFLIHSDLPRDVSSITTGKLQNRMWDSPVDNFFEN